jgi:hypothetical protein
MLETDQSNPEAGLRDFMVRALAGGFTSPEDIAEAALDYDPDIGTQAAAAIVQKLLPELVRAKLASEAAWPAVTDCDRLDAAFADLTKAGIVCRQNFTCCQNCGFAEIGAEIDDEAARGIVPRGFAFFHQQDTESATEQDGRHGLHLSYGALTSDKDAHAAASVAIGRDVVAVLAGHDLICDWDGTLGSRIRVKLDWQRRLAVSAS